MGRLTVRLYDTSPHYARWLLHACAVELVGVAMAMFFGVGTITTTHQFELNFVLSLLVNDEFHKHRSNDYYISLPNVDLMKVEEFMWHQKL